MRSEQDRFVDVVADFEAVIQEVRDARPVPFSASAIVDRKDLLDRLEGLLEAVPGELKKARWIIEDRDEVLARIQREAQETLERARHERDRMLSRPEIDRAASVEAERVIETAKSQARDIRFEAEHFVDGKLASLEVGLQKMLALVQSASSSFTDVSGPPPRPASAPKRAAIPRPSPAPGAEQPAMRPADPLELPHTEARSVQQPATTRPPAAKAPAAAPGERSNPPRPVASRGSGQAAPAERLRPPSTPGSVPAAPKREEPPAGPIRTLGLGSPRARPKPARPPAPVQPESPTSRTSSPETQVHAEPPAAPAAERRERPERRDRPDRAAPAPRVVIEPDPADLDWPADGDKTGTVRVIRSPRPQADPPAPLF
jgi:hypothetical protein